MRFAKRLKLTENAIAMTGMALRQHDGIQSISGPHQIMLRLLLRKNTRHAKARLRDWDLAEFLRIRDAGNSILRSMNTTLEPSKIEARIRSELGLHHRWPLNMPHTPGDANDAVRREILAVRQVPGLAEVFLHHGDGRIREEAIRNLRDPLRTPASVSTLCWRLNDWVPGIRRTALGVFERVMQDSAAETIVPALYALLPHIDSWGRWSDKGSKAVLAILDREDVATLLLESLKTSGRPHLGLIFRTLSRNPAIDTHLPEVFATAPLPHVRKMALDMLLSEKARWPTGQRLAVWIDRSMGRYRTEPEFAERAVSVHCTPIDLIATASSDRSAMVRKAAADGVIALRRDPKLRQELDAIAASLQADPNIGVRNRIDFYMRKVGNP